MAERDTSIDGQIARLAVETGAPDEFVQRIRELFSNKGISLDGNCDALHHRARARLPSRAEHSHERASDP